jgi:hypothetical protein
VLEDELIHVMQNSECRMQTLSREPGIV